MNYIVTSKQLFEASVINNTLNIMNNNEFNKLEKAVSFAMEAYKAYKKINVLVIGYNVEDIVGYDTKKISNRIIINIDSIKIYDEEKIKGLYSLL